MDNLTRILYNAFLILRIKSVRCFPGMFSGRNKRIIIVSLAFFVFILIQQLLLESPEVLIIPHDKTYSKDLHDNKLINYKNSIRRKQCNCSYPKSKLNINKFYAESSHLQLYSSHLDIHCFMCLLKTAKILKVNGCSVSDHIKTC